MPQPKAELAFMVFTCPKEHVSILSMHEISINGMGSHCCSDECYHEHPIQGWKFFDDGYELTFICKDCLPNKMSMEKDGAIHSIQWEGL